MTAATAIRRVTRITIEICETSTFTSLGLARRIFGAHELGRAVRVEVNWARHSVTVYAGLYFHWEVETVYQ